MKKEAQRLHEHYLDAKRMSRHIDEELRVTLERSAGRRDQELQDELFKKLLHDYAAVTRKLKEKLAEIERLSVTDRLTQVHNRMKFDAELEREIARAKRHHHPLALILFDLDHFKKVNDTHGHAVGDAVLVETAALVKRNLRVSDTFARWGGEEFIVLLPETTLSQSAEVAEKLRHAMEARVFPVAKRVTCSFGCAVLDDDSDGQTLLKTADQALYRAKNLGRNRVEF